MTVLAVSNTFLEQQTYYKDHEKLSPLGLHITKLRGRSEKRMEGEIDKELNFSLVIVLLHLSDRLPSRCGVSGKT